MIKPSDVALPNYSSIFKGFDETETFSFMSTINFFEDLFICSEELKNYENKGEKLKEYLRQMNSKLPSCVYIPFAKSNANPMQIPIFTIMCSISSWMKRGYSQPK